MPHAARNPLLFITMLASLALIALAQEPSLQEIDEKLRKAVDRSSYESGAADAAKALADMRSREAMGLRLELFESKWETYHGVLLRDWFYTGMLAAETREEGDLLARAASDSKRGDFLRILCLQALAASDATCADELLFDRAFEHAAPEVNRAWQVTAGKMLAERRVTFERSPQERAEAARNRLLDAGAPGVGFVFLDEWSALEIAMLAKAASSAKDPADRAETLRVLAARKAGMPSFLSAATTALRGKDRAPLVAALEAAVQSDAYELVPEIISLLERAEKNGGGRHVADGAVALRSLTGLPFGPKPEMWKGWWEKAGAEWLQERRQRNNSPNESLGVIKQSESATVSARFFGLPVDSSRVAIVVDGSGSMSASQFGAISTVEAAAREVESFCARLPEDAVFQMWIVEVKPEAAFKKAVPVNKANRLKAMEFLRKRLYRSTSSVVEALEAAMQDPDIDTIVFVGDGGSSSGKHQLDAHVLEAAKRLYARYGVRIHTVLVTDGMRHERLMEQLAEATGGQMARPTESNP